MAYYREVQIEFTSGDLSLTVSALNALQGTEQEMAAAKRLAQQLSTVRDRDREIVVLIRGRSPQ